MIKVVWICHFSNKEVRKFQNIRIPLWEIFAMTLMRKPKLKVADFAVWITNAIHEFERFYGIELHVIAPVSRVRENLIEFNIRGVYYHFFKTQGFSFLDIFRNRMFNICEKDFKKNRLIINSLINKIQPQIVHVFGAENPYYSLSLLDVPKSIPTIMQLDTLLSDPDIYVNYPNRADFVYRSKIEKELIKKATYIATTELKFINIIQRDIKPDVNILNITLALNEEVHKEQSEKSFDFVYFANGLYKAFDLALEGFGIAHSKAPNITLDVIGGYSIEEKAKYDERIAELNVGNNITFEGYLQTHEEVMQQIRKSRFALLPLRTDLTSGTIREAMANGLPVVTTDTGELGTQMLNAKDICVLISSTYDHDSLANNMLRLINDPQLAGMLQENGYRATIKSKSNREVAEEYLNAYSEILNINIT